MADTVLVATGLERGMIEPSDLIDIAAVLNIDVAHIVDAQFDVYSPALNARIGSDVLNAWVTTATETVFIRDVYGDATVLRGMEWGFW